MILGCRKGLRGEILLSAPGESTRSKITGARLAPLKGLSVADILGSEGRIEASGPVHACSVNFLTELLINRVEVRVGDVKGR